jgi:hypothetical protein
MTVWMLGTGPNTFYPDAAPSVIKGLVEWHFAFRGFYGYQTNNLTLDGLVIRGDTANLNLGAQSVPIQGVHFDDYLTRNLTIQNADIQGMETGIQAPIYVGDTGSNPGALADVTTIQNSLLDNVVNIDITPPRTVNGSPSNLLAQRINITNVKFANPAGANPNQTGPSYNISMDYVTSDDLGTSNMSVPQSVFVTNYNGVSGDNFQVYYSQTPSPTGKPPAGAKTRSGIEGLIA